MRVFANASVLWAIAWVALLAQAGEFSVNGIEPRISERALLLNGRLDLAFNPKVEEALGKGIPMDVLIDVRLYRERPWLWDERVADWSVRRRVSYHALTGQYLIKENWQCPEGAAECRRESDDAGRHEPLGSLGEALRQAGSLNDMRLPLPRAADQAQAHAMQLRVYLDIEALPAPLRPVAYTSGDWHLNSGWTTWKVAR